MDNLFSPDQQLANSIQIGDPTTYQRKPFDFKDVENQYPIMDVLPDEQRNTIPIEQQIQIGNYQTQQKQRQVDINRQLLSQQIAQTNFNYQQNIIDQTKGALPKLSGLNPDSDDFDAQVAKLQGENPLAFQDQHFYEMIHTLAQTHNMNQRQKDILMRDEKLKQDQEHITRLNSAYNIAQKFGPQMFNLFDEKVKNDPENASKYASELGQMYKEANIRSSLQNLGMSPDDINNKFIVHMPNGNGGVTPIFSYDSANEEIENRTKQNRYAPKDLRMSFQNLKDLEHLKDTLSKTENGGVKAWTPAHEQMLQDAIHQVNDLSSKTSGNTNNVNVDKNINQLVPSTSHFIPKKKSISEDDFYSFLPKE